MLKSASAGEAYDAPPDPLVARGFLPSAIAASLLRRLHFPHFSQALSPQSWIQIFASVNASFYLRNTRKSSGTLRLGMSVIMCLQITLYIKQHINFTTFIV